VDETDVERTQHVESCKGGATAGHVAIAGWLT